MSCLDDSINSLCPPLTNISHTPTTNQTFLFVKNGEVQGRLVGANPDKLREAVFSRL